MAEQLSESVMNFVRQGRNIDAIKQLRQETGLGLKEAKHRIDAVVREYRIANPNYGMQEKSGSKWPIVFLLLIIAAGYYWFTSGD
ncbi:MAG: hypothetical protein AAF438_05755 [Pseudomonadota bacterium]